MSDQLELLNRMANNAAVLSKMAPGVTAVDMAGFFLRPGNFMLGDERGAALFGMVSFEPRVYEGHYLFLPGSTDVFSRCQGFIDTVFTDYNADAIVGHVPVENRPSRAITRALGFTRRGTSVTASGRSCVDYVLERYEWVTSLAASLAA